MTVRKHTASLFFAIHAAVLISFFMTSCRKDIPIPNEEVEKIFGQWEWKWSGTGGFNNYGTSPSSVGYTKTIEFNKNGIYRSYKNGEKDEKYTFTITEGPSTLFQGNAWFINYKKTGLFHDRIPPIHEQEILFFGQDTLRLFIVELHGYSSQYIRKQ